MHIKCVITPVTDSNFSNSLHPVMYILDSACAVYVVVSDSSS